MRSEDHDPRCRRNARSAAREIAAPEDSEREPHERRRDEAPKPSCGKDRAEERLIDPHVETLRSRHADLESEFSTEAARPAPDVLRIRKLKRRKLRVVT
ncbi:MAG: DUF465 domain-containing protein [Alphaproteobacteria bacterium]|nr:DUF465 domain-containing protein [Alphaproteobacteria bacterium]